VVVTENTGMGDIIKKASIGITIPQDDPEALVKAISTIFENPTKAQEKVEAGQKFIKQYLNWTTIVEQYESFYQMLISK
jgi:glycosyltransferase involved in cell wall biosynthesis